MALFTNNHVDVLRISDHASALGDAVCPETTPPVCMRTPPVWMKTPPVCTRTALAVMAAFSYTPNMERLNITSLFLPFLLAQGRSTTPLTAVQNLDTPHHQGHV